MLKFSHDVAGGQGNLIATSVQSPNFVHGVSGWQIARDGAAEFHDIIIPAGSGGTVVTFAGTAPASPNDGDVWYDTASGLEASVWNGSSWAAYQIGTGAIASGAVTTPLIAANAITAAQIANAAITGTQLAASVTARSLGGITTTIAASAPGSPVAGDIWIDSASGYQISQYSGSAWTAVQWTATDVIAAGTIDASLITANTITASQLAAGIVYAGIVDATTISAATFTGSTFDGTDFIIDSAGAFFYSGTPAAGNLVASIAAAAGSDGYGNAYVAGFSVYDSAAVIQLHVNSSVGAPAIEMPTGAASEAGHASVYALAGNTGLANEFIDTWIAGAGSSYDGKQAAVSLVSATANGTNEAAGELVMLTSSAPAVIAYWDSAGIHLESGKFVTADTWHALTLDSGWSAVSGFHAPSYRLNALGNVELTGRVTGSKAAAAAIATLPSGYYSSSSILDAAIRLVSSAQALPDVTAPGLYLTTGGVLEIQGISATAGTVTLALDCTLMLSAG